MKTMTYKKTEHFEPIAMKCTQEQFESIKPILEELGCIIEEIFLDFIKYPSLVNNNLGRKNHITNHYSEKFEDRTYYEKFNAETFLKACGIVSEPLYQLTAKEVVHAYKNPQYLKDTFKECFETELELNVWLKSELNKDFLYLPQEKTENGYKGIVINDGFWSENYEVLYLLDKLHKATEKEVEEALVKEAIKRGYENGNYKLISGCYGIETNKEYVFIKNTLYFNGDVIFSKGNWAEILNTYTITEAESKFNIKIKAV